MKKLHLPIYLQKADSVDCGPISIRMILEYFEIKKGEDELKKKLYYNEIGTTLFDNGSLLLDEGLKTTIITAQPMLFPPDIVSKINDEQDVLALIKKPYDYLIKYRKNLETWENYIAKGGKIRIEIPQFRHIISAIDNNSPILALIHAGSLGSNEGAFHFVVICGYDENKVFIHNALPTSVKQGWFPIEQFMFGLHASTTADIDNGGLLIVSK